MADHNPMCPCSGAQGMPEGTSCQRMIPALGGAFSYIRFVE